MESGDSLCLKGSRQKSGTCYYNSTINGFLLSPNVLDIVKRELDYYIRHDLARDAKLRYDFYDDVEICMSRALLEELAKEQQQSSSRAAGRCN